MNLMMMLAQNTLQCNQRLLSTLVLSILVIAIYVTMDWLFLPLATQW